KKEYSSINAPCALYAVDAPLQPNSLSLNPTSIGTGQTSTGTVILNGLAASGGKAVYLTSSSPYVSVPTSITLPEGSASGTFTASSYSTPPCNVTVTVTATCTGAPK